MSSDYSAFSMLDLFRMEAETHGAALSEGLLALEQGGATPERVEPLMRAAHSIKGAARVVGLDAAVKIAHVMEDFFVAVQEGKAELRPDHVDTLLSAVDMLLSIARVPEAESPAWLTAHAGDIDKQAEALRNLAVSAPPAPSPPVPSPPAAPPPPPPPMDLGNMSMLDLFRMEAETHGAALSEGLLALEQGGATPERVEPLMRAAHSIKGAARVVGLDAAVKIAHAMEDFFVAVQEGKAELRPDHVDTLLQATDALVGIGRGGAADNDALLASLAGLRSGAPPPAAVQPGPAAIVPPAPAAAPPAPSPPPPAPHAAAADRVVRVSADSLERLMGLAGESLVEARWLDPFGQSLLQLKRRQRELARALDQVRELLDGQEVGEELRAYLRGAQQQAAAFRHDLTDRYNDFETYARRTSNLSDRLYHEVVASRMRPFEDGARGFPRLVRDLARTLGKKVRFEILGKDTAVDRDILEKLEAPLNHMLRNSLDHGIETVEERAAAGKPAEATVKLEARHRAGMLAITVADDGRGVDLARLRVKIADRGLATADMAARMSDAELLDFLFLPGFSTAAKVTEISGRGVGLDVVHAMIQEVGGTVRAVSQPGHGMAFHLQLPLTLSVVRTVLAEIDGEPYAFPLSRVDRIVQVEHDQVTTVEGRPTFMLGERQVGLVDARQVLELGEARLEGEHWSVVVLDKGGNRYGLVVDRFLGQRDLVVRPLDPRLGKVQDVSAAAVLADGSPVLILDVEDLARSVESLLAGGGLRRIGKAAAGPRRRKRVLVVDDSLTVREVERQLLEQRGYDVTVAVDGMDGWNAVRRDNFDMVISDVDMPRMNGIELVARIKADPELRGLPVAIVSYKDREEDRMKGLAAGADYYLTKSSFQDDTLLKAVVDLIGPAES